MPDNPTALSQASATDTTSKPAPSNDGGPAPVTLTGEQPGPEVHLQDKTAPEPSAAHADPSWWDTLPADLKAEKSLESFKSAKPDEALAKIAKSYVEGQKMLGGKVSLPTDKSTPEEVAAFWKKAGAIPDKPEDYKLQKPILPNGMEMQDAELAKFAAAAHSKHIPPAMAQEMLNHWGNVVKGAVPDYQKLAEDCLTTLKGEWGPGMDRNLGVAKRALYTTFGKDAAAKVESTALGSDPDFVRGMYQIGKMMIEEGSLPTELAQGMQGDNAKGELDRIYADSKGPYYDGKHPQHDAAVQHVRNLELMASTY